MPYTVKLTQSWIDDLHMPTAELTVRQVLEARLGGPHGVEAAYRASYQVIGRNNRLTAPPDASGEERRAVERWQRAVIAAIGQARTAIEDADADWHEAMTKDANLLVDLVDADGTSVLAPY